MNNFTKVDNRPRSITPSLKFYRIVDSDKILVFDQLGELYMYSPMDDQWSKNNGMGILHKNEIRSCFGDLEEVDFSEVFGTPVNHRGL